MSGISVKDCACVETPVLSTRNLLSCFFIIKVNRMKPVSKTAFYCCGVRMQDAESARPVIGDNYAKRLMSEEGLQYWEEFKEFKMPNASNIARAHVIDNYLRQLLSARPDSTVILIGAGLDSRAYRLTGGSWVEIDEPGVIEYKNEKLPVSECENPLVRIPIDFETQKLTDKLSNYRNRSGVIIIIEGVLMYLTMAEREALVSILTSLFAVHVVLCDLMTKKFFEKLGQPLHKKIKAHGASFTDMMNDPADLFLRHGYRQLAKIPTIKTSIQLGLSKLPKFAFLIAGKLLNGYAVYEFSYHGPS